VLHQQDVEELLGKRPFEEKRIFAEEEGEEGTGAETDIPPYNDPEAAPLPGTQAPEPTTPAEPDKKSDEVADGPDSKP
jgi:hypothetical protein